MPVDTNIIVSGRSCTDCSMCCMVLKIEELNKPKSKWCQHCSTRKSCDIYGSRPKECENFYCGYLTIPDLDERWKPNKSKIVLVTELEGNRITAYVDPKRPDVWKREPYYSYLKMWSEMAIPHRGQVVVSVNGRMYLIFPDRDVDLGIVDADNQLIITGERQTPSGIRLEGFLIDKNDPRAEQLQKQTWSLQTIKEQADS